MTDKNDKINHILGQNQKISEKYLELGSKYFNVTPDTIKSGMFGYVNEIMAHSTKQGIFHRNMMYNEYFFNTASLPSSIYNFQTYYNVNVDNATPSKSSVIVSLDVLEMKKLAVPEQTGSNVGIFTLKRSDSKFIMGDFVFMLPFDIKIKIDGNTLVAQYDINSSQFNQEMTRLYVNNPFIVTYQDQVMIGSANRQFAFLRIDIYQYQEKRDIIEIKTNNLSDQLYFNIQFPNQLVDFQVTYKEPTQNEEIIPKFLSTVTLDEQVSKFVMFNYTDTDQYALLFPTQEKRFRPIFNSVLNVTTFNTMGSKGNFIYTGNVIFNSDNDEINKMQVVTQIQTNPTGGKDRPTLKELKQKIFRIIKSNNSLTTEDDLNDFFQNITSQNFQNGSKVKFIKYRDDIIKREFNGFVLVADSNGLPVSTNTVDVYTSQNEIEVNSQTIPSGSIVIYDSLQKKYRFLRQNEYPEEFMTNNNTFVYQFPFLGHVQFDPYIRVQLFNNFVKQKILTQYTSISQGTDRIVNFTQVNVDRNPVLTKEVAFRCVVTSDEMMKGLTPSFQIYAIFETNNDNRTLNTVIGYKKMEYSDENKDFFTNITVTDRFNDDNKMIIQKQLKDINSGLLIEEQVIPEEINVRFAIAETRKSPQDELVGDTFKLITELANMRPIAYLNIDEPVKLYESVSDVIRSDLFIENGSIKLQKLPLIASTQFFNTEQYSRFMDQMLQYIYVLRDNFGRLKNNTDINIKFYNTYGLQYLFDIDRVDLALNLEIKLQSQFQTNLDQDIKKFIVDYVTKINDNQSPRLSMSNLMTSLEKNFQEIEYINFKSLNNAPIVNVSYTRDIQVLQEQNISITPEILQIGYIKKNPDLGQADVPNITIKYI